MEHGSWKVFLADFGLCRVMSTTNVVGTKTMLAGSPGFQSPEQLRNENLGLPTDVYALGAVLYVLFGETQVWPGLSPYQIMYKVAVNQEKPDTACLVPQVRAICEACFEELSSRPPINQVLRDVLMLKN